MIWQTKLKEKADSKLIKKCLIIRCSKIHVVQNIHVFQPGFLSKQYLYLKCFKKHFQVTHKVYDHLC